VEEVITKPFYHHYQFRHKIKGVWYLQSSLLSSSNCTKIIRLSSEVIIVKSEHVEKSSTTIGVLARALWLKHTQAYGDFDLLVPNQASL